MDLGSYDVYWVLVTAGFTGLLGAMAGSVLVIRKEVMMGDALSHSLLPGLVLGHLLFGGLVASVPFCLLFSFLALRAINILNHRFGIEQDSAIAVVYTLFFSFGVILISRFAENAHIDLDAVLAGELLFVPLNATFYPLPDVFLRLFVFVCLTGLFLFFFRKLIFHPERQWINIYFPFQKVLEVLWQVLLSLVIITLFDAVGTLMAISFLVTGPGIALLFSRNLKHYIFYGLTLNCLLSVLGAYLALLSDLNPTGVIAGLNGGFFVIFSLNSQKTKLFRGLKTFKV